MSICVQEKQTVQEILERICSDRQINATDHFLRLLQFGNESFKIPDRNVYLLGLVSDGYKFKTSQPLFNRNMKKLKFAPKFCFKLTCQELNEMLIWDFSLRQEKLTTLCIG